MGGRGAYFSSQNIAHAEQEARNIIFEALKQSMIDEFGDSDFSKSQAQGLLNVLSSVQYNSVKKSKKPETRRTAGDIIAGGDKTDGSCVSAAYAYALRRAGYDVTDFRGGKSQTFFSYRRSSLAITNLKGVKSFKEESKNDFAATHRLLKNAENGKEYILITGQHAAVVTKSQGSFEYWELQSNAGFHGVGIEFNKLTQIDPLLKRRWGAKRSRRYSMTSILIDADSLGKSDDFRKVAGFFNTKGMKEQKGVSGNVK